MNELTDELYDYYNTMSNYKGSLGCILHKKSMILKRSDLTLQVICHLVTQIIFVSKWLDLARQKKFVTKYYY